MTGRMPLSALAHSLSLSVSLSLSLSSRALSLCVSLCLSLAPSLSPFLLCSFSLSLSFSLSFLRALASRSRLARSRLALASRSRLARSRLALSVGRWSVSYGVLICCVAVRLDGLAFFYCSLLPLSFGVNNSLNLSVLALILHQGPRRWHFLSFKSRS